MEIVLGMIWCSSPLSPLRGFCCFRDYYRGLAPPATFCRRFAAFARRSEPYVGRAASADVEEFVEEVVVGVGVAEVLDEGFGVGAVDLFSPGGVVAFDGF